MRCQITVVKTLSQIMQGQLTPGGWKRRGEYKQESTPRRADCYGSIKLKGISHEKQLVTSTAVIELATGIRALERISGQELLSAYHVQPHQIKQWKLSFLKRLMPSECRWQASLWKFSLVATWYCWFGSDVAQAHTHVVELNMLIRTRQRVTRRTILTMIVELCESDWAQYVWMEAWKRPNANNDDLRLSEDIFKQSKDKTI